MIVTLAEWLTRWPAKPFPFGSAGSSPAGDEESDGKGITYEIITRNNGRGVIY
ncbi:hypothetical protein H8356DRAFT_1363585 [Neocallimastix lanati (nom. inval.)]|nr:hypothetical protein H8356DRAFT_1363585 [Neocallimastix sp. JGI-2020a]